MLITASAANALSAVRGPLDGTYAYTTNVRRIIRREPERVSTVLPVGREREGGREGGRKGRSVLVCV